MTDAIHDYNVKGNSHLVHHRAKLRDFVFHDGAEEACRLRQSEVVDVRCALQQSDCEAPPQQGDDQATEEVVQLREVLRSHDQYEDLLILSLVEDPLITQVIMETMLI